MKKIILTLAVAFLTTTCRDDSSLRKTYWNISESKEYTELISRWVALINHSQQNRLAKRSSDTTLELGFQLSTKHFSEFMEAFDTFETSHPEYSRLENEEKQHIFSNTVSKINTRKEGTTILRLKKTRIDRDVPSRKGSINSRYSYETYRSIRGAYQATRRYANSHNQAESGGYGFGNGSGIVYYDSKATEYNMSLYSKMDHIRRFGHPTYTFHYHSHNASPSPADVRSYTHLNRTYGLNTHIIVTPNIIRAYTFHSEYTLIKTLTD